MDDCLNYIKRLVVILDRRTKTLQNKVVDLVKVEWQHQKGLEWTWEPEDKIRELYPLISLLPSKDTPQNPRHFWFILELLVECWPFWCIKRRRYLVVVHCWSWSL